MGYAEHRIPRPNAGTPKGMGDFDPPDDEPDVAQCECCEETGYLHDTVKGEHGRVCNSCNEDYDQCASGESPECWEGWVLKYELTYLGGVEMCAPLCPACMAEEQED